ncbi:MAG: hypothetical protein EI684_13315 [Candidatus Viridilinea halotolerans]|uniref:AbrB/MazE/SpoVT family DNA-binding domain-containing protein n=1 Tax=Candidatus Viridilinea halotolerans TaxID=2491704 RepID=A0A426TXJ1_9CHLR|nr:MAG: hypothetical protein EI684_13315 [Candidatus Viridilinea halotolerans]
MGTPTKIQLINRKDSQQYYVNFPMQVAQALDFTKGEIVEWTIHDRSTIVLTRRDVPPSPIEEKKTPR